jgi:DNA-binding transcriptional LysR family regulator
MELERRHLEHLSAVARHRNVTRAAEALGITQPSLSRSIQEIERALGIRCFDRLPQGAVPTPACLRLLERARPLIDGFEDLEREAQRLSEHFSGPLVVGLGPAVAAGGAMREVTRLLATYPQLECQIVIASAVELLRRLAAHEIEFFAADQTPIDGSAVPVELEALDYHSVLLCRSGHPILESDAPLREVTRYPLAAIGPPPLGLASLRELLREGDPSLPASWMPTLSLDHAASLETVLAEGDFLGASVSYAHGEAIRSGAFRVVPLPRPLHRGRVGPVRLRGRTLSPAAEVLWKAIVQTLRRDLALGIDVESSAP